MEIDTTITLDPGVEFALTPSEAADAVLNSIGGGIKASSNVTLVRRPESTRSFGMSVQSIVTLVYGDQPHHDAPNAAIAVLEALDGDPDKDYAEVRFNLEEPVGTIGNPQ